MIINNLSTMLYRVIDVTVIDGVSPFSTEPSTFTDDIYLIGLAVGGVIASILVAVGSYTILTSAGDVQKVKDGREQITNAVMGFALILLAGTVIRIVFNTFLKPFAN